MLIPPFSSASTFRQFEKRGGADGARIALAPQKDCAINRRTLPVIDQLRAIKTQFDGSAAGGKRVSLADLIVLGGCAAGGAGRAGGGRAGCGPLYAGLSRYDRRADRCGQLRMAPPRCRRLPQLCPGRFRLHDAGTCAAREVFLDRADLLGLSAPERTVLTGGLRVLGANCDGSLDGAFTDRVGTLLNDFFTTLTSMDFVSDKADASSNTFHVRDRDSGEGTVLSDAVRLGVRRKLAIARGGRGLCRGRRPWALRPRLRGGVGQG